MTMCYQVVDMRTNKVVLSTGDHTHALRVAGRRYHYKVEAFYLPYAA